MLRILSSFYNLLSYKAPKLSDFELLEDKSEKISNIKSTRKSQNKINESPRSDQINKNLEVNLLRIQDEFKLDKNSDVVIRKFKLAKNTSAFLVFIDGMVDRNTINNFILKQMMKPDLMHIPAKVNLINYLKDNTISIHDIKVSEHYDEIFAQILNGLTALFVDGYDTTLIFETRGYEKRSVEKPVTETVITGSQEGFTENLRTNITLIRRIVRNKKLISEILPIGNRNNSMCAVLYLDDVANPEVIKEVITKIKSINIDSIQSDGMLEQFIEDHPYNLFPQIMRTERPDRAASFLIEGRVVIVVDGSPFILTVPVTFFSMLETSEDTNMRWQFASLLKLIRVFGLLIATLLPGLYIAMTLYHQEMIPTDLLATIAKSRETVPFPAIVEVILMEVSFELIREAGLRVPSVVGTTLGIVGALILGQAAVSANIVSPILIIIVAITGLGNYAIPNFSLSLSIRILRFIFILLGGIAGFFGISAGIFVTTGFMCSIKSFGVPFLSPVAPKTKGQVDFMMRRPIFSNKERPDFLNDIKVKKTQNNPRGWTKK